MDHVAQEVDIPFDVLKPIPIQLDEYKIPEDQASLIREAFNRLNQTKLQLADLEINYHNDRNSTMQTINESATLYHRLLQQMAQTCGLAAQGGRWDFDIRTLTYKRRE